MENDQSQLAEGKPAPLGADGGTAPAADIEETGSTQPEGQSGSDALEEKKDLPPELEEQRKELLRAFHKKTQALADKEKEIGGTLERYKSDANVLYELGQQSWFKKAVEAEKSRRAGVGQEISDEEFEAAKNDKKAFQNLLAQRDRQLLDSIKSEFKGELDKLSSGQKEMLADREFEAVVGEYGDEFVKANDDKALDPYLGKGLSYEDAFLLHMQKQGKLAMKKKSDREVVSSTVSVEKGGMPRARGGQVVKARSLGDALDRAFDLARKGAKDYRIEKT